VPVKDLLHQSGRDSSVKDLLPSGRTQRATFRATMPMLPYLLPSKRTKEATFEVTALWGGQSENLSINPQPLRRKHCKNYLHFSTK
jgi:hypothetical protein